jgi:serine/threonine protein kinase
MQDLKPQNIFWLPEFGFFQLGDFGGFIRISKGAGGVWAPSFTIEFASPEEAQQYRKLINRERIELTSASDFWKLGITLVLFLVGCLPPILAVYMDECSEDGCYDMDDHWQTYCWNIMALASEKDYWDVWLEGVGVTDPLQRDFLVRLLMGKPEDRITMEEALNHPWVKEQVAVVQQLVAEATPKWEQRRVAAEEVLEEDDEVEQQQQQQQEQVGEQQQQQQQVAAPALVADASTPTSSSSSGSSTGNSSCRHTVTVGTMTEPEAAEPVASSSSRPVMTEAGTMTETEAAAEPAASSSSGSIMAEVGTRTECAKTENAAAAAAAAAAVPNATSSSTTTGGGSQASLGQADMDAESTTLSTHDSDMAVSASQESSSSSGGNGSSSSNSNDSRGPDAALGSPSRLRTKSGSSTTGTPARAAAGAAGEVEEPVTPPAPLSEAASAELPVAWSSRQRSSSDSSSRDSSSRDSSSRDSSSRSSSSDHSGGHSTVKGSVMGSNSATGGGGYDSINTSDGAAATSLRPIAIDNSTSGAGSAAAARTSSTSSGSSGSRGGNNSSITAVTSAGDMVSDCFSQGVPCMSYGLPEASESKRLRFVRNRLTGHTKFEKVPRVGACSAAAPMVGSSQKKQRGAVNSSKQAATADLAASSNRGGVLRWLGSLLCMGGSNVW